MRIRPGLVQIVATLQLILLAVHFLLYETWTFHAGDSAASGLALKVAVVVLSLSFVAASLLAFRYTNSLLRAFYRIAAVWLGTVSFLFLGMCAFWVMWSASRLAGVELPVHKTVGVFYGVAAVVSLYGVVNASFTRLRRVTVKLEGLPEAWRGRRVALISDLHVGHVRNEGFLRRIVRSVMREKPDAIFIAGDLYDGTAIDAERAAAPLRDLHATQGTYFVAGNHEQFGDDSKYLRAIANAAVRVLHNERVEMDGLQIIGVPYRHATHDEHLRSVLRGIGVDKSRASVLLTHAPDRPHIAAEAGISLQLSGHTHLGQFFPWTWVARRIYRQLAYGLSRVGKMQIYTSSGAGTWGPPSRVGSHPEITLIEFAVE
jgi:predicted MPP superfamily phosphohydrolase